jgi:hypothetical protein
MPTIADSTLTLNSDPIHVQAGGMKLVPMNPSGTALRSPLPVSEVLATVTATALSQAGSASPMQAMWQKAISNAENSLLSAKVSVIPAKVVITGGVPAEIVSCSAVQEPIISNGVVSSQIIVGYSAWAGDSSLVGVQIWFTGYRGNASPQLMATGQSSPVEFVCDATKETVTVTVVSYGGSGLTSSFADAPTTTVLLSGVVNPPPGPTMVQGVTPVGSPSTGWQFGWNALSGLQDVIVGYWVYRSLTNTPPGVSGRVAYQAQPNSSSGTLYYIYPDPTPAFFWVSAIDSTGMESVLISANTTTTTHKYYPSVEAGDYSNPSLAYDGNLGTSATCVASAEAIMSSQTGTGTGTWSGFPVYSGTPTAMVLTVLASMVLASTGGCTGSLSLSYSPDNGVTWIPIPGSFTTTAPTYCSISIPLPQVIANLQVCATSTVTAHPGGRDTFNTADNLSSIYEINLAVTQSELG